MDGRLLVHRQEPEIGQTSRAGNAAPGPDWRGDRASVNPVVFAERVRQDGLEQVVQNEQGVMPLWDTFDTRSDGAANLPKSWEKKSPHAEAVDLMEGRE
jgi:hypothetical protein